MIEKNFKMKNTYDQSFFNFVGAWVKGYKVCCPKRCLAYCFLMLIQIFYNKTL